MKNIEGAWNNEVFGGLVFNPIKAACSGIGGLREKRRDGKKVEKTNSLRNSIQSMPMNFNQGAGYYVLKNIRTNQNTFLDIFILSDGRIENRQDRLRLKHWNNYSLNDSPNVPPIGEDFYSSSAV